jgi:hypothetical protein
MGEARAMAFVSRGLVGRRGHSGGQHGGAGVVGKELSRRLGRHHGEDEDPTADGFPERMFGVLILVPRFRPPATMPGSRTFSVGGRSARRRCRRGRRSRPGRRGRSRLQDDVVNEKEMKRYSGDQNSRGRRCRKEARPARAAPWFCHGLLCCLFRRVLGPRGGWKLSRRTPLQICFAESSSRRRKRPWKSRLSNARAEICCQKWLAARLGCPAGRDARGPGGDHRDDQR